MRRYRRAGRSSTSLGNPSPVGAGEGISHGGKEEGVHGEAGKPGEERVLRNKDIGKWLNCDMALPLEHE